MSTEMDAQKSTWSSNKTISLITKTKKKTQKLESLNLSIDDVFNKVTGNQTYLYGRESMNECQAYPRHIHKMSYIPHPQLPASNPHTNTLLHEIYMNHTKQVQLVNMIYLNYETILSEKISNTSQEKSDPILSTLLDDIKSKIHGYKRQDIKKFCNASTSKGGTIFTKDTKENITNNVISAHDAVELLVSNRMKCIYCKESCYIIYRTQYDKKQWTLDRIDNDIGHTIKNVVVCCLECNIKRGSMNKERFEKGKQIRVIRKLQF